MTTLLLAAVCGGFLGLLYVAGYRKEFKDREL